uniref:Ig-like domain-containing protein n=1 Tax=Gopherus evgoodei TaxID=1825980 RepID=A0A8C4W1B5_9SAUR
LPRPSISLSPTGVVASGADVTIRCQGQRRDVRFFLHKAGDLNPQQHMDRTGAGAEFRIPTVGRQHGGNYSCSYRPRSDDPVELVVAGEGPSLASCSQPHTQLDTQRGSALMGRSEPGSALSPGLSRGGRGRMTDGLNWGRGEVGGAVSPLFNSCLLLEAGREYPKPTIWVSPSRVVALGGSVTIRCEGQYPGMEFVLHKPGHSNPQGWTVRDGTAAEFPIPSVGREDGGSYTCEYHSITDQNRWSYLSDPVEIIVAGEGPGSVARLPAPHPARSSRGLVRCWGKLRGVRFVLNKQRRHFPPVDSDGSEVVFRISNVSREHGGNYSCSYHSRSEPFAVSYPSDPMELVVRGEGPGSASLFPAPPPARPSWGFALTTQRGRPAGEWGQSHWGVPQPGGSSSFWRFRAGGGGIPAPGGAAEQGPFPGDAPPAAPALGTHRGVKAQELPSRPRPQPQTPLPGLTVTIDAEARGIPPPLHPHPSPIPPPRPVAPPRALRLVAPFLGPRPYATHGPAPFCPFLVPRPYSTHSPAPFCPPHCSPATRLLLSSHPHLPTSAPKQEKLCPRPRPLGHSEERESPSPEIPLLRLPLPPAPAGDQGLGAGASPTLLARRPELWGPALG